MPAEMTEITVQYVNFPREGKKRGNIKASEGQQYWCLPALLREFSVGEVCKIEYTTNEEGFHHLNKKIWGGNGTPKPAPKQVTRQRTNPTDRDDILVAVLLKEPRFDDMPTTEIVQLILKHKEVARLTATTQIRDDMNDEIPVWPALHQSENPADGQSG